LVSPSKPWFLPVVFRYLIVEFLQFTACFSDAPSMAYSEIAPELLISSHTGQRVGIMISIDNPDPVVFDAVLTIAKNLRPSESVLLRLSAFEMRLDALRFLARGCDRFDVDPAGITVEVCDPYEGHVTSHWLRKVTPSGFSFAVDVCRSPVDLVRAFPVSTWLVDMAAATNTERHHHQPAWSGYLTYLVAEAQQRLVTEVYATNVTTESERALLIECGIEVMSGPIAGPFALETSVARGVDFGHQGR
jgi:hypothetical protein